MSLNVAPEDLHEVQRILHGIIPDRTVVAFGSRVKGTARPSSDLDLLVLNDPPLTLDELSALTMAFSESNLPYFVDIVSDADIDDEFRSIIMKQTEKVQNESSRA